MRDEQCHSHGQARQPEIQLGCPLGTPVLPKTPFIEKEPGVLLPTLIAPIYSLSLYHLQGQRNLSFSVVSERLPCICPKTSSKGFPAAPTRLIPVYRKVHVFWVLATRWRCSPKREKSWPLHQISIKHLLCANQSRCWGEDLSYLILC